MSLLGTITASVMCIVSAAAYQGAYRLQLRSDSSSSNQATENRGCVVTAPQGFLRTGNGCASVMLDAAPLNLNITFFQIKKVTDELATQEHSSSGQMWPSGDIPNTIIDTKTNVVVGGLPLPSGRYSLYCVPSPGSWTLIINRGHGNSAQMYDSSLDVGRVSMNVAPMADSSPGTYTVTLQAVGGSDPREAKLQIIYTGSIASVYIVAQS